MQLPLPLLKFVHLQPGMSPFPCKTPLDPVEFLHCPRFADIHILQPHSIPFPTEPCDVPEPMPKCDRVFLYHDLPVVPVPYNPERPVIGATFFLSPFLKILKNVLSVFSFIFPSLLFFLIFGNYCTEMSE